MISKLFRFWLIAVLWGWAHSLAFGQVDDPCVPAVTPAALLRCAFGALPMAPKPIPAGAVYVSASDTTKTAYATYLYPNGSNAMPASHRAAGETIAAGIQPLNANGKIDLANGKIVVVVEGMSNTNDETIRFIQAFLSNNPAVNPQLQLKNLSQPGCNLTCWLDKGAGPIDPQVQIVMMKHSNNVPQLASGAPRVPNSPFMTANSKRFPYHAQVTQEQLKKRILAVKAQYPNLKLLYLTSRTYGGWSCSPAPHLSYREPVAFEEGFSVKWLVASQILGTDADLDFSGSNAKAPWLAWGPYIWDSTWPQDWYRDDVHPCVAGQLVVAQQWYDFLMQDGTSRPWFRDNAAPSAPASLRATPVSSKQVDLAWNAATDNSGAAVKYKIYRDGVFLNLTPKMNYSDAGLNPTSRYCYTVSAVDSAGNESTPSAPACAVTTGVADGGQAAPLEYKLLQNHPNPAMAETEIRFQLPQASQISVKIYNIVGDEIRTLIDAPFAAGAHHVHWDGTDDAGNPVANGVYIYQLRTVPSTGSGRGFSQAMRMILLR